MGGRLAAFLGVLGCAVTVLCSGQAMASTVDYELRAVRAGDKVDALSVRVRFRAAPTGVTFLHLPHGYGAGSGEGWRSVRNLRVSGATAIYAVEPARRAIHSKPNARLTASYLIVPADDRDPSAEDARRYRPVIRPTYFYALGETVFAQPEGNERAPASFTWTSGDGLPFASDLLHPSRPLTLAEVQRSTLIGGSSVRLARSGSVTFAMAGEFSFSPEAGADLADDILANQRAFWGDPATPYLVAVGPVFGPSSLSKTTAGNGRSAGIVVRLSPGATLDDAAVLLAHEMFHTWNAAQLGGLGPHGASDLWFSEGLTEYYARELLLRSGRLSPGRFRALWNDELAAYAASSARTTSNASAAAGFWSNPQSQRIPYQRGALLAAVWDARLRARSEGRVSLDDVLRTQRRAVSRGQTGPATGLFIGTAASFGFDVAGDIEEHIERGAPIELPPDAFRCARVSWREQPNYDRGWDVHQTSLAGDRVVGLRSGSAAARAGLREGDRLLERRGDAQSDSGQTLEYLVESAAGDRRWIRFKPEGTELVRVQHLTAVDAADCFAPH